MQQITLASGSEMDRMALKEQCDALGINLETIYQELEMNSAYADCHRDISREAGFVRLHSHSFYELIYCVSSDNVQYLIGTERYRLQRGDIVMVPPGVSHRPLLPEKMPEPYKRYVLWISPEFAQTLASLFPEEINGVKPDTYLLRTEGTGWEHLGDYFRTGVQEAETARPGWEMAVVGNTMILIAQLQRALRDSQVKPLKAEQPDLLDRVMGYVEANLERKITLSETARYFYVSESTISQMFRKKMGVSFYRCVTQRRLIAAKSLIEDGIPMEEVSGRVGFTDYSSFYRAFKQEYGISPRQYRKILESIQDQN
jgi:AraC-like DNA-binding protein/mannose-6-phosphate isomerase-like protein (cupin superfamily)